MKVTIGLMVGSNGKAAAQQAYEDGSIDWGILADSIMDYPERGEPKDPEHTSKHLIEVDVEIPKASRIAATIIPA